MSNLRFDLCIIGTGPAGLILALEYTRLNPNHKVALVEYGKSGVTQNLLDDSIEISSLENHHPVYECTNKGFGGSSLTWGGRCVMYDEVDFIDRPSLDGGCTWNLDLFNEVKQYSANTAEYFECGKPIFDIEEIVEFRDKRISENFQNGIVTDSIVERWSMPTRFGKRYREDLLSRDGVQLFEGFEALNFGEPDSEGQVRNLCIRELVEGSCIDITASNYVLAAGTQESTRILLKNSSLFKNIHNPPSSLGKYYQGHLSGKIASIVFSGDPKKTEYGFLRDKEGIYLRRRFQFDRNFLVNNDLLNTAIWLDNPLYYDPKHKSGAMSMMYLMMITPVIGKRLAPPAIADSITKGKVTEIKKHLFNVLKDFPFSLIQPAKIFYKRYLLKRKLPGVFLYSPENRYALHFHSEQIPHEKNQMTLKGNGQILKIDYALTDKDVDSVVRLHKELDKHLRETDSGFLEYWFKEEDLAREIRKMSRDGIHQSGTTRIADTSEKGVVDKDLKVFGTKNVYVCSSSVFPTSGQANPTFFLGAFAVRLANHLTKIK
jgi:hypothetical protein